MMVPLSVSSPEAATPSLAAAASTSIARAAAPACRIRPKPSRAAEEPPVAWRPASLPATPINPRTVSAVKLSSQKLKPPPSSSITAL